MHLDRLAEIQANEKAKQTREREDKENQTDRIIPTSTSAML